MYAAAALALLGCAQTAPGGGGRGGAPAGGAADSAAPPGAMFSGLSRPLQSPPGATEVLRMHGEGAQIFRCEARSSGEMRWTHRLPDAQLRDDNGKLAVRHGANQSFEHVDGSRLIGEVIDHVPAPDASSIPWLLLKTRSYGSGSLSGITFVERINTVGGMPPDSCTTAQASQLLRVAFSADFVFFR
jgi:hypothetical protein